MATFSGDTSDFQRLDWSLLQNGPVTLDFRRAALDADVAWLRENAYQVVEFDCLEWSDVRAMHVALAKALSFPDYYGMNLDALNDRVGVDVYPLQHVRRGGSGGERAGDRVPALRHVRVATSGRGPRRPRRSRR
jgi:hypothetical protein